MEASLVAEAILSAAIRTLPGDPVAGHTPHIFQHTHLTNAKAASAGPAERKYTAAAITLSVCPPESLTANPFFNGRVGHQQTLLFIGFHVIAVVINMFRLYGGTSRPRRPCTPWIGHDNRPTFVR